MEIFLVQHAESRSESEDPLRSLTDKGREEAGRVAKRLSASLKVGGIWHSPKLRAKQTAEIFSKALGVPAREMDGMKPLDDPRIVAHMIGEGESSIMLVGHLPHLNELASFLIAGDDKADVIAFRNAAVVCLGKEEKWRVRWILTPEFA